MPLFKPMEAPDISPWIFLFRRHFAKRLNRAHIDHEVQIQAANPQKPCASVVHLCGSRVADENRRER